MICGYQISQKYHWCKFRMMMMTFIRGGFRGVRTRHASPLFFSEIGHLLCVSAPRQKRMHQIVQINFENYKFSLLLRRHIPLRHPLSPQAPKFCQSLIWAPPLFKNPGSAPVYGGQRSTEVKYSKHWSVATKLTRTGDVSLGWWWWPSWRSKVNRGQI